jgi:hypothetical protein
MQAKAVSDLFAKSFIALLQRQYFILHIYFLKQVRQKYQTISRYGCHKKNANEFQKRWIDH